MDAHDGTGGERPHLNQIAQVIHEPEPEPALSVWAWMPAPDEGVVDPPLVANLTDHCSFDLPHPQDTSTPTVPKAVGDELVDREDEVRRSARVEAARSGQP